MNEKQYAKLVNEVRNALTVHLESEIVYHAVLTIRRAVGSHLGAGYTRRDRNAMCAMDTGRKMGGSLW